MGPNCPLESIYAHIFVVHFHFLTILGHKVAILYISASYLVAKFHKVLVMHSKDTGPRVNLGPFGPIVTGAIWFSQVGTLQGPH